MTANGAASTSVYPQEDDDGNPVGDRFFYDQIWAHGSVAHYRVRILHV